MKKLQILVPHYKEEFEVMKPLLDSIAIQQSVDLKDVGVIIVNDGDEVVIDKANFTNYPFDIDYYINEHKGVSATRNACLDKAEANYVMFCDCDDMFANVCALWVIFREMSTKNKDGVIIGFDALISVFMQETVDTKTGAVTYINRGDRNKDGIDSTFVHGKVYKRKYLLDNNIRWNEKLTIHEDSYFNCLCQVLTTNVRYISNPIYLWKWRGDSVCRRDPKYLIKTYINLIDSASSLIEQYILKGKLDNAKHNATHMIYNTYFNMNKPEWMLPENKEYRDITVRKFKEFYNKYEYLYKEVKPEVKNSIIKKLKNNWYDKGVVMESFTFDQFITYIKNFK